jgi:hypothetical protein
MIEHVFTLKTDRFNVTTPRANFINPRCFGEDFAVWLKSLLEKQGLNVSRLVQEDWGWALIVSYSRYRFTISIGIMDESIGRTPAEWRVGIGYERPLNGFWALFKRPPVSDLRGLSDLVRAVLGKDPRISGLVPA